MTQHEHKENCANQRLDEYLSQYHFSEKHSIIINASLEQVFRTAHDFDIGKSSIIRVLIKMRRRYGSLFSNKAQPHFEMGKLSELTATAGFIPLMENVNREIVFGFTGKFWQPAGVFVRDFTPAEFLDFNPPGYCKGIWNFYITGNPDGTTTLSTETRILCLGLAKLLFPPYWLIVRPFSGWIRLEMLRMVKEEAEGWR